VQSRGSGAINVPPLELKESPPENGSHKDTLPKGAAATVKGRDKADVGAGAVVNATVPERPKRESQKLQEELMRAGHSAVRAKDYKTAKEKFSACYKEGGRVEARISAANMTFKLKDYDAAVDEYASLLKQGLPESLHDVIQKKYQQALARSPRAQGVGAKAAPTVYEGIESSWLNGSVPSSPLSQPTSPRASMIINLKGPAWKKPSY